MSAGLRKFVHVFATFEAGGPQVRAVQLIRRLGSGHRHLIVAMDGNYDAAAQLPTGIEVGHGEAPAGRGYFGMVRALATRLRTAAPDLVLTYNWGAIEAVAAARRANLPLVHHEDGFGTEEIERRFRRRNWMRRLLLKSVPVVVPSAVLRDIALREWRLPPANVHLLPNGVDLARFAPARRDRPAITFGTVGGLRQVKDHATLLAAFAQVPGECRLRIVGGGPLEVALRALAGQLGVAERVDFVGPVADTAPEYREIDVFVLSSRTEQMPIALLEAMASGCSAVSTDVGDVRAILPPEQQPFVVPAGDVAALAAAMARLAKVGQRAELGAANRRHVESHYEAGTCLDRFLAVYDAATSRSRS